MEEFPFLFDGKYMILQKLGSGAKGTVYKARNNLTQQLIAIKILHKHLLQDKASLTRFRQEAKITCRLSSPYIVQIFAFATTSENEPYLVMEYLEGQTLADCLKEKKIVLFSTVIEIFRQAAAALETASKLNIVHRDLKPDNIFVVKLDQAGVSTKIIDFGLAKIFEQGTPEQTMTQTNSIVGTFAYMSPEQCQLKVLDSRSDIYSLGCIVFELLCGHPPFSAQTGYEMMVKHKEETAQFPEAVVVPAAIKNIVLKCLKKDPAERFQTPDQLLLALDNLQLSEQCRIERKKSINKAGYLGLFLVVAVICIFIVKSLPQKRPPTVPVHKNKSSSIHALYEKFDVSPGFFVQKAKDASRQERCAEAIAFARHALKAAEKDPNQYLGDIIVARMAIVGNLSRLGRAEESIKESKILLESLQKYPDKKFYFYGYAYRTIGDAYLTACNYKEANRYFNMALQFNVSEQTYCQIYSKLAFIACENNNAEEALSCLKQSDYYAKRSETRPEQWSRNYALHAYVSLLKKEQSGYRRNKAKLIAYLKEHPSLNVLENTLSVVDLLYRQKAFSEAVALYDEIYSFASACQLLAVEEKEKALKPRRQYLATYRKQLK